MNDLLTTYRKGLFYAARKLYKSHKICAAWTQHGNVLVRRTEGDQATEIKTYDDLENFQDRNYYPISTDYNQIDSQSDASNVHGDELSHLSDYTY